MKIEDIRAELKNGLEWRNGEVEDFYCRWWVKQPYYRAEMLRLNRDMFNGNFIDCAKILNDLSDEEIMGYWAQYVIEKGET